MQAEPSCTNCHRLTEEMYAKILREGKSTAIKITPMSHFTWISNFNRFHIYCCQQIEFNSVACILNKINGKMKPKLRITDEVSYNRHMHT